MGRELQKHKRRSGKPKVTRRPKSKKQILNNPIIAANWDSKQTLSQNYARLGLTTRLNKKSGGTERHANATPGSSLAVHPSGNKSQLKETTIDGEEDQNADAMPEVRVERDPETGAILRIIETNAPASRAPSRRLTAAEESLSASRRKGLNPSSEQDMDKQEDDAEFSAFTGEHASDGFVGSAALADASNSVFRQLSDAARSAKGQPKAKRKQSARERDWCARLVAKHGDDISAMFKDRSMNVLQLSQGQLRDKVAVFQRESAA